MRVRTMADGSLRIEVEVSPTDAQAAFALFGSPGAPMALAALKTGYAAAVEPEKPKGGALAKLAGMWCADKTFQSWIDLDSDYCAGDENGAALRLYEICEIQSRRQLDHDPAAAERFNRLIRGPYMKWRASKGLV